MAGTPNFNIPKPVETDNIDVEMRRLQQAWDAVDTILKSLTDLVTTKAASVHTHTISQINGLLAALNDKMASNRTFTLAELTDVVGAADAAIGYILQKNSEGKFVFSSPASVLGNHEHPISQIVGLRTELDAMLATITSTRFDATRNRDQFRTVPIITVTNLIIRSGEMAHSNWTATNVTKTAAAAVAPDGTMTAAKITETAVTGDHGLTLSSQTLTAGQPYTQSVFVKAAERTKFRSRLATNIGFLGDALYDLALGTITAKSPNITNAEIEDWGNGWFRCSLTAVAQTGATAASGGKFYILNDAGTVTFLGEVGKGLLMWGAQLENGVSKMGPYIPTVAAAASGSVYSNRHLAEELAVTNATVATKMDNSKDVGNGTGLLKTGTLNGGNLSLSVDKATAADIIAGTADKFPDASVIGPRRQSAITPSGNAFTFPGIPAGVQRVAIKLSGIVQSANAQTILRLGTAGGILATGYTSAALGINGTGSNGVSSSVAFLIGDTATDGASPRNGVIELTRAFPGSTKWLQTGAVARPSSNGLILLQGSIDLAAELTQVQITTLTGVPTFSGANSVAIEWGF